MVETKFAESLGLTFLILSDPGKETAKATGCSTRTALQR
jgi:peroxiredoxin